MTGAAIVGFPADLGRTYSTRFQWALAMYEMAERCRQRQLARYESLKGPADVEAWGRRVREYVVSAIGGLFDLPETARFETVRRLEHDGVKIELIRYEAFERLVVPAAIYHSAGEGVGPGIFIASGHSWDGKGSGDYQRLALELAHNGFTVLYAEPMGLGERKLWPERKGPYGPGSHEHNVVGLLAHLAGENLSRYMLAEARYALSILQGLASVDASRIGVTGHSGGGIMTSLLALTDDRVGAAMAVCSMCDRYRLMATAQCPDAEQLINGLMRQGIATSDLFAGFAPKPLFLGGAESDIFPADGGFLAEVQHAERLYELAGASDSLDSLLVPGRHAYGEPMRHEAIGFFSRHLDGPKNLHIRGDCEIGVLTEEQLYVTENGNVYADIPDCAMPQQVIARQWKGFERPSLSGQDIPVELARLLDIDPKGVASGELYPKQHAESAIELGEVRYVSIVPEVGMNLGAVAVVPAGATISRRVWLVLAERGSDEVEQRNDLALDKLGIGDSVYFADVRGCGSAEAALVNRLDRHDRYGTEFWFAAYSIWMQSSTAAARTRDVLCWLEYLRRLGHQIETVNIVTQGRCGLYALFACVLARGRCGSFEWADPVDDWDEALGSGEYDYLKLRESTAVFGIARVFSLRSLLEYVGAEMCSLKTQK